jgi:hypothetical protein
VALVVLDLIGGVEKDFIVGRGSLLCKWPNEQRALSSPSNPDFHRAFVSGRVLLGHETGSTEDRQAKRNTFEFQECTYIIYTDWEKKVPGKS